jgi:hypothetical protein
MNLNERISPKTFLKTYIYEPTPLVSKKKKRPKISMDNFEVPKITEYNNIIEINYNVSQLRSICRYYKLKISGNKKELMYRLFNYLKYSNYCIKIQKMFRGWLQRHLNKLKGLFDYSKICTNDKDFFTFQKIKDLSPTQMFTYKDIDGFAYGFDICSLYNMFKIMNKSEYKNPYTRRLFPKNLNNKINKIIKLSKIVNQNVKINIEDDVVKLSAEKKIELKVIEIFQKIDNHGFITDTKWFLNLTRVKLLRYLKELLDIWDYRAQLTIDAKKEICPPNGNPFYGISLININTMEINSLKNIILKIIEIFITRGLTNENRSLGAFYVLGSFTIVNHEAANALPWMYETFMVNIH